MIFPWKTLRSIVTRTQDIPVTGHTLYKGATDIDSMFLTLSQTKKPRFLLVCSIEFLENTVEKGEIARNEPFILFPQYFLHVEELSTVFIKWEIVICKHFQFGTVKNMSFRKKLNYLIFWTGDLYCHRFLRHGEGCKGIFITGISVNLPAKEDETGLNE